MLFFMDELLPKNVVIRPPFLKKSVKNTTGNKLLISGTILHAEIYRQLLR